MTHNLPDTAPVAKNNSARREARKKIAPQVPTIRQRVFDYIRLRGGYGATGSEIAADLNILPYTAKPRCTELAEDGYVMDSHTTRSNARGNAETVWKITPHGRGVEDATPRQKRPRTAGNDIAADVPILAPHPTPPNPLPFDPVRMDAAEVLTIENWIRDVTFQPSGEFTPIREVAGHVRKLLGIYKSCIA